MSYEIASFLAMTNGKYRAYFPDDSLTFITVGTVIC